MANDTRREGDERSPLHESGARLTLLPEPGQPFRWLPKHGEPSCIGEWASQHIVRAAAYAPVYTAIVSTIVLALILFGVPFVEE